MMHRATITLSLALADGEDVDLEVEAGLRPGRAESYGEPAEDPDVEIHAIHLLMAGSAQKLPCPAAIEAECERSDHFAERLLAGLQEDLRRTMEDREPVGLDF